MDTIHICKRDKTLDGSLPEYHHEILNAFKNSKNIDDVCLKFVQLLNNCEKNQNFGAQKNISSNNVTFYFNFSSGWELLSI